MNRASLLIAAAVAGCALLKAPAVMAQTIVYDFETNIPTGATGVEGTLHPTGPDGFYPNTASESNVTQSTTGVETGSYSMQVVSTAAETYGGAITANVPSALITAPSLTYCLTGDATGFGAGGAGYYFDILPVFFSTDGEIDPDTANQPSTFNNLTNTTYNLTPETLNLQYYKDPLAAIDGDSGDYTIPQILAQDQTEDPTDAITSFQFTIEHSGDSGVTLEFDDVNVPSSSVPEPASMGLLAAGALILARRRRS